MGDNQTEVPYHHEILLKKSKAFDYGIVWDSLVGWRWSVPLIYLELKYMFYSSLHESSTVIQHIGEMNHYNNNAKGSSINVCM